MYAALDDRCVPDFLEQFQDSGDVLTSTDGTVYRIFLRKYASGAQVHIPGFKGPYNHYIVFALPTSREYAEHHYDTAQVPVTLEPYQKRSYQWYFYETFNHLEDGTCPQDFCMDGTGGVRTYRSAPQRKYLYRRSEYRVFSAPSQNHLPEWVSVCKAYHTEEAIARKAAISIPLARFPGSVLRCRTRYGMLDRKKTEKTEAWGRSGQYEAS